MSIYRASCRITERVEMKKLYAKGVPIEEISGILRVQPQIITDVVEGKWDKLEKAMTLEAMKANEEKLLGKQDAEANRIAQIAAAAAAAINGQAPVVDANALRAEIEAQVRAEMAEEVTLTRGQKAAATRKANAEAKQEEDAA